MTILHRSKPRTLTTGRFTMRQEKSNSDSAAKPQGILKVRGKQRNYIIAIFLIAMFCIGLTDYVFAQTGIEFLNIQVENIDGKTVKIKWSTNVATRGKIIYGKSSDDLNCYLIDGKGYLKYHEMLIGNLASEATYYFQIIASDNDERVYSFIRDFKTSEHHDKIAPKISDLRVAYVSGTVAVIEWRTDEEGTSVVEFDEHETYKKVAYSNYRITDHQIILRNLSPNIRYYIRVYSVDKDNNKSSYFLKEFTTYSSDQTKEDLIISYLRPSGPDDSNISDTNVTVSFKTNHYAKGSVKLAKKGHRTQTKNLDYGLNHQAVFNGLFSNSEYILSISIRDIFNKKAEVKNYIIKTAKTPPVKISPVIDVGADFLSLPCSNEILSLSGYYGQYYNLLTNTPNISKNVPDAVGEATGWYDNKYLSFSRIDSNLDFGNAFFPVDEGLAGDPFYFSVYWRAILEVPVDDNYNYHVKSDDDSWVYIDNNLITDLRGIHKATGKSHDAHLTKGLHTLEIYFAERKQVHSYFSFTIDNQIKVHPWPTDCSFIFDQGISDIDDGKVVVKGIEFSYYTPASALYKTSDSPDIYAIANGQRHYISSPASFREHGYSWADIKTVSWPELSKYPRARLIKSPDSSTIYYLYQRPEGQWLKTAIPSPTAFVSYPGNFWGNVITVTQLDINSYPDVKLIRTADDPAVYYLENNVKYFISEQVFKQRDFSIPEIAEVSQVHLDTYKTGLPLK